MNAAFAMAILDLISHVHFGKRPSRKNNNVVVFPFAFHIAVLQLFKPLWSRLLLYELEPSRASFFLCLLCILIDNIYLHIYAIRVFIYCASYIDYVTSDTELRKSATNEKFRRRSEHFFYQVSYSSHRIKVLTVKFYSQSQILQVGRDSSVGTANRYGLDCPGVESRWGWDFPHPSVPGLGPTHDWYRVFLGGKAAGAWPWPPTLSNAEVKQRVEL